MRRLFLFQVYTLTHPCLVAAQNDTIGGLVQLLVLHGYTTMTEWMNMVLADNIYGGPYTALLGINAPQTLFVPTNDAFTHANDNMQNTSNLFQPESTEYLFSVLSYHQSGLAGPSTGISYLGNDIPQAIIATANGSAIEIQNQVVATTANSAATLSYNQFTIQVLNEVIGFPPAYSYFASSYDGLSLFQALAHTAGAGSFDDMIGVTIFLPYDQATGWHNSGLNATQPGLLLDNHVVSGQTHWSSTFTRGTIVSDSHFNYSFAQTSGGAWTVTLNHPISILYNTDPSFIPQPTSGASSVPTQGSHSLAADAIASIVIGLLVVLAIVVFGAYHYLRLQRRKNQSPHRVGTFDRESLDGGGNGGVPPSALRTSPFTSEVNVNNVALGQPELQGMVYRSSAGTGSQSSVQVSRSGAVEKFERPPTVLSNISNPLSSDPSVSAALQQESIIQLATSDAVVDWLLQRLAQRVDHELPPGAMPPPGYPGSADYHYPDR